MSKYDKTRHFAYETTMKEDAFEKLRNAVKGLGISQIQLARETGIQQASLSRFLKGAQATLNGDALIKLISYLGGEINLPGDRADAGKDVCFVNAQVVPAGEYATERPVAEDYMAAPLVGEAGAGPGYLPQDEIKSWFLVYKNLPAVRYRRNLIAVEIGKHSTSMQPTLNPRDIVLIDRDDREVTHPGHMMLVLDPMDGAGMIKRVAVEDLDTGDFRITYYSDNVVQHPPRIYSLQKDFGGDWEKVIVGRVIWAWSDVREK